ncbi:MAG: hypothetical protein KF772_00945 [Cryobacterium sp.]|nr:hypothetical protein [Cryobacterium sp.]MCO5294344.1 hypothetical protein [Homoserinimonas sp.]
MAMTPRPWLPPRAQISPTTTTYTTANAISPTPSQRRVVVGVDFVSVAWASFGRGAGLAPTLTTASSLSATAAAALASPPQLAGCGTFARSAATGLQHIDLSLHVIAVLGHARASLVIEPGIIGLSLQRRELSLQRRQ